MQIMNRKDYRLIFQGRLRIRLCFYEINKAMGVHLDLNRKRKTMNRILSEFFSQSSHNYCSAVSEAEEEYCIWWFQRCYENVLTEFGAMFF